jgi:hypothetical protein
MCLQVDLASLLPSTLDESSPAQLPRDLACPLPSTLDESSPAQPPRDLACPLPSNLSLSAASLGQSAAAAPLHISAGAYHGSLTGPESFLTVSLIPLPLLTRFTNSCLDLAWDWCPFGSR